MSVWQHELYILNLNRLWHFVPYGMHISEVKGMPCHIVSHNDFLGVKYHFQLRWAFHFTDLQVTHLK